jgi:trans-aconitate methyltransferase
MLMFLGFIILGLVFVSILAYFLFVLDGFFGGLDFTSNRSVAELVINVIKQRHLENGNFYDLGSARGAFAIRIAKAFPGLQVCGIDDSRLRTGVAKIRGLFLKNLSFKREDIFKTDVSVVDAVYLYLPQELMPALQVKLQKELKHGSVVISTSVSFPSWQPTGVYDLNQKGLKVPKLFVYIKA